jgi:glucose-6-phosphate isomerase
MTDVNEFKDALEKSKFGVKEEPVVLKEEVKEEPKKTERTVHMLAGQKVNVTEDEKAQYDALHQKMNDVLGDRLLGEVPLGDEYYKLKAQLDLLVASFRS